MKTFDELAQAGYSAYAKQAGGKTHNGRYLPSWAELGTDLQACWVAAAKEVTAQIGVAGFNAIFNHINSESVNTD
jgi:hypothetical protein